MANPIQQGLKQFLAPQHPGPERAAMANPIQQGLKLPGVGGSGGLQKAAAMANPIQQGLKRHQAHWVSSGLAAAMANPIQQGLKRGVGYVNSSDSFSTS